MDCGEMGRCTSDSKRILVVHGEHQVQVVSFDPYTTLLPPALFVLQPKR